MTLTFNSSGAMAMTHTYEKMKVTGREFRFFPLNSLIMHRSAKDRVENDGHCGSLLTLLLCD